MKLKVLKIAKYRSKRNPNYFFYYIFFKSLDNGRSYKTCISDEFRNYRWWEGIEVGDIIEINDEMIRGNLVDADAIPKILCNEGE
jgi:hypothetical protein